MYATIYKLHGIPLTTRAARVASSKVKGLKGIKGDTRYKYEDIEAI